MPDSNTLTFLFTVVVAFAVLRWFINTPEDDEDPAVNPSGGTAPPQTSDGEAETSGARRNLRPVRFARRPVTNDMIEVVQTMAPQLTPEQIRYDLERSGSVQATVERFLSEGSLPFPPGYVAPPEPAQAPGPSGSGSGVRSRNGVNLIKKYGLENRVNTPEAEEEETEKPSKMKWSQSKEERQQMLKKQREEMILKARRKLEAKEKEKGQ